MADTSWIEVDRSQQHCFYDNNGDGIIDTVYGIDANKNLVSQSIGVGGQSTHFVEARYLPDDWATSQKNKHESESGAKFISSSEYENKPLDEVAKEASGAYKKYQEGADSSGYVPEDTDATGAYGAQNITKEDFFTPQGKQQDFSYVVDMLADKLKIDADEETGRMGRLSERVNDFLPRLKDIDTAELGFLREQYGAVDDPTTEVDESINFGFSQSLAGRAAQTQLGAAQTQFEGAKAKSQQDIYGLQKGAKELGAGMRSVYSGSAAGLRGVGDAQQVMRQQFGATQAELGRAQDTFGRAQDAYALAQDKAGLEVQKGVYDLQEQRFDEVEFKQFIDSLSDV